MDGIFTDGSNYSDQSKAWPPGGGGGGRGGEVSENLNNHFLRNYWPDLNIIFIKC